VSVDLSYFDLMVPCGISGVVMTSMERETGARIPLGDVAAAAAAALGDVFSLEVYERSERELTGGQSAAIKADEART